MASGSGMYETTKSADFKKFLCQRVAWAFCPISRGHAMNVIDQWLNYCQASGMSTGTLKIKRNYLERLSAVLDPLSATESDLVAFLNNPNWRAETRRSARSHLRSFYSWAHRTGHIQTNPAQYLMPVKVPPGKPKPADPDAINAALENADVTLRCMILLAAYAGLRRNEIATLRVKDVEPTRLRVTGKGGRVRLVPIHPVLNDALAAQIALVRPSEWVFPGRKWGEHIGVYYVWEHIKRATGGLPPHTLRHRFATNAYRYANDLRMVQELLGHSSPNTTALYVAVDDDKLAATVASVA